MTDDLDLSQVVFRKTKDARTYKPMYGLGFEDLDGKKKVKWSDSTELREKMKEYRRSQLSICLDYQHIAVEEEREREGVKKWRESKDTTTIEEDEENPVRKESTADLIPEDVPADTAGVDDIIDDVIEEVESEMSDSDDDPYCDEVLEAKLRMIKAIASRHTLLPAYTAGVQSYESWLDSDASPQEEQQKSLMSTQLDLYKQIIDLYSQWSDTDDVDKIDKSYQAIMLKLIEAKKLTEPPQSVADSIASVLNDETNVKKHKQTYSSMVDSMVTDLSQQIETTTL